MRYQVTIVSMAPYPVQTEHTVDRSTIRPAIGTALDEHWEKLRARGSYRKRGKRTSIIVEEME